MLDRSPLKGRGAKVGRQRMKEGMGRDEEEDVTLGERRTTGFLCDPKVQKRGRKRNRTDFQSMGAKNLVLHLEVELGPCPFVSSLSA